MATKNNISTAKQEHFSSTTKANFYKKQPDLGREEATIEFVTGGDALSLDQTGGRGEDVEGGGSPAQIMVADLARWDRARWRLGS